LDTPFEVRPAAETGGADEPLVLQFESRLQEGLACGGA